MMIVYIMLES